MEQQACHKFKSTATIPDDFEIVRLIQLTYLSKTTAQVSTAQATLNNLLLVDKFIEKLFFFLENQEQLNTSISKPQQFKLGVAILIKKFSYQFAKQQQANKEMFVEKLFCLLVSKLNSRAKEQLGVALQYILNHDQECIYKPKVIQKVSQILESQPDTHILEGSVIISVSCLNSLIEVDDQFSFIYKILDSLIKNSINLLEILRKQPQQNLVFQSGQNLFKLSKRIFDLMELAFSRLIDEQDLIDEKLDQIRKNPGLQLLFFSYLTSFSYRKSILSTIPHINATKQIVVEIIFCLYRTRPMPQNIFNLCFLTLLLESQKQFFEEEEEHIMTRIMELLEDYLDNKFYMNTFADHKMQLLICLLTYAVTKPDEFDMLQDNPERFVQMAQDFTQGFKGSVSIKVRAASFLRVFASRFDQALRNILQIVVIIVTASVQADDPNSTCLQLYNSLKQEFSSMGFFKLDSVLHLQTCLNVLSLLSPFISKREDLKKVVYAILVTHFDRLQKIEQPIVALRLIRMIGYYPTAIYYNIIKSKMSLGKVYILQGLKAFERILKANKYPQIFEVLSEIFAQLITVMNVSDHIFQTIIINHYERILKKNLSLYNSFLIKIRDTFIQSLQKNQHFTFTCLGYIYSMLNKENEASYRNKIVQYFYSMEEFYNKAVSFYTQKVGQNLDPVTNQTNKKVLKNLKNYEDKIIDIYSILIKKQTTMTQRMIQFSISKLSSLHQHNKNQEIFKMYNNLFLKINQEFDGISVFYQGFMQNIRNMFVTVLDPSAQSNASYAQKLQILPNLSYLVSQIFACWNQIDLSQDDVVWMLKILNSVTEDVRQYILLIILTYAYIQPIKLRDMLSSLNSYYETLQYLLTTRYEQGLIRKIFLLAMTKLIQIEQTYINDIVRQCIKYLKEQYSKNQTKKKQKQHIDPKMRRLIQDGEDNNEEQMTEEKQSYQKKSTTCSVPEFKHPYIALSEYDQFKIKIWQNSDIVEKLDQKDKNELREILTMDWVGKSVRRIISVKQPLDFA